jgi:hypothetical protein
VREIRATGKKVAGNKQQYQHGEIGMEYATPLEQAVKEEIDALYQMEDTLIFICDYLERNHPDIVQKLGLVRVDLRNNNRKLEETN